MALLDAVQNVAAECGYTVNSSIAIGSEDTTTVQLVAIAQRLIREMVEEYNWPQLIKTGTFQLADGEATYSLPADFSHYHYDTFWNQSDGWRLFGPLTTQEYAERIGWQDNATVYDEFLLRGMTDEFLTIHPTPGPDNDSKVIVYQYTSERAARPATWVSAGSYITGQLTWYNGKIYRSLTDHTGVTNNPSLDAVNWLTQVDMAYPRFLADTDEPMISQRVLEQGMMERFAMIKELNVQPMYESQLEREYAKYLRGQTLYAGGTSYRLQYAKSGKVVFGGRVIGGGI